MIAYIDSSVLLRYLFNETNPLKEFSQVKKPISSVLLRTECFRCLDRARIRFQLSNEEVAKKYQEIDMAVKAFHLIQINSTVLDRAEEAFPTLLGTLDAIHLSSALIYRENSKEELFFFTHDTELGYAAQAKGFSALGI